MTPGKDCKLLEPALVAASFGEPHPERARLARHLRSCAGCRRELASLRAAQALLDNCAIPTGRVAPRAARAPVSSWVLRLASAAAVLLLAVAVFARRPSPGGAGLATGPSPEASAVGTTALALARETASPGTPFTFDDFDRHVDRLQRELSGLEGEAW